MFTQKLYMKQDKVLVTRSASKKLQLVHKICAINLLKETWPILFQ